MKEVNGATRALHVLVRTGADKEAAEIIRVALVRVTVLSELVEILEDCFDDAVILLQGRCDDGCVNDWPTLAGCQCLPPRPQLDDVTYQPPVVFVCYQTVARDLMKLWLRRLSGHLGFDVMRLLV